MATDKEDQVFQTELLHGAAQLIVRELTPERLEKFALSTLSNALGALGSYHFKDEIRARIMPVFLQVLERPTFMAQVQETVEKIATELLGELGAEVKATIVKSVQEAIKDKIHPERARRGY